MAMEPFSVRNIFLSESLIQPLYMQLRNQTTNKKVLK